MEVWVVTYQARNYPNKVEGVFLTLELAIKAVVEDIRCNFGYEHDPKDVQKADPDTCFVNVRAGTLNGAYMIQCMRVQEECG